MAISYIENWVKIGRVVPDIYRISSICTNYLDPWLLLETRLPIETRLLFERTVSIPIFCLYMVLFLCRSYPRSYYSLHYA